MSVLDEVGLGRAQWWATPAGVRVARSTDLLGTAAGARAGLERALDSRRGMLIFRGDDYAIGYTDPPIEVTVGGGRLAVRALNERGRILLPALRAGVAAMLEFDVDSAEEFTGVVAAPPGVFAEEDRTRHAGVFRALRAVVAGMSSPDELLGLYGAFGYDLIFEVDPIPLRQPRGADHRDLVLHLPDEIVELDFARDEAVRHCYEFVVDGRSTAWCDGATESREFVPGTPGQARDHRSGEYAEVVEKAMPMFRDGELFEVVPSQVFRRPCTSSPAELFRRLRLTNPAPHSLLANLGDSEYLVGASPEMFVGVARDADGLVVRTSPISGTIARGRDALQDADRIRELLNSAKEESELTMCTDVDRNDKARVCVPGTVRVTARRKIEMYSALIHTVDHVEGLPAARSRCADAFLAHLWAVTVTGAPKLAAVEFIERTERSPRRWYGGAVGRIGFDGTLDTVLTLRTIQVRDGIASVRAGATLLYDSDPAAEEAETELKAKALLRVLDEPAVAAPPPSEVDRPGAGLRFLLVDHRDSFVHCLADYLRQTGAEVVTYRAGNHLDMIDKERPDLVVLSPGPGKPADFGLSATIARAEGLGIPVFGVCLGLQGIVEHFGGTLNVLDRPVHGKQSTVVVKDPGSPLFDGLPAEFAVGRYHSLYAAPGAVSGGLDVTATTDDGVVMAVTHRTRPFAAVQFHPESIMTAAGGVGLALIDNVVAALVRKPVDPATLTPAKDGPAMTITDLDVQRTWRSLPAAQQPEWPDPAPCAGRSPNCGRTRRWCSPARSTSCATRLAAAARGEAFLLQGGDCAETFAGATADDIRDRVKTILQMAVVLTYGASRAGRQDGPDGRPVRQAALERHRDPRRRDAAGLPRRHRQRLRLHAASRAPGPAPAGAGLPHVRVDAEPRPRVHQGGFADLRQVHAWNQGFVARTRPDERYERLAREIDRALRFMQACGADFDELPARSSSTPATRRCCWTTSDALTRIDSRTGTPYDLSGALRLDRRAHPPARRRARRLRLARSATRSASSSARRRRPTTLLRAHRQARPRPRAGPAHLHHPDGRRQGPRRAARRWSRRSPPPAPGRLGLRPDARQHLRAAPAATRRGASTTSSTRCAASSRCTARWARIPGGIHVELTGDDVTECLGGGEHDRRADLATRYETLCDPRLNHMQSLELAFLVAELYHR